MKHLVKSILFLMALLLPFNASAYDFSYGGFYFNFYGGSYVVITSKQYISEADYTGNIKIPDEVTYNGNTYKVVGIWSSAFKRSSITSVEIPSTVTFIGQEAFCACHSLSKVVMPYSISSIEKEAFCECYNLVSIDIPSSVNYIGLRAFSCPLANIYCYPTTPVGNAEGYSLFSDYLGILHVPGASLAAYFISPFWCNFGNIIGDAIEPTDINISRDSLGLYQGKQYQLNACIVPANATTNDIYWSSTNGNIARVDNGLVTAVGLGECDIIATNYGMKAICHLTVSEETAVITLDQHEASVLPNHILTLIPTVTPPSTDLSVSSSEPTVAAARVVNGKVQVVGIKEGTTIIMVNAANGNGQPDSCLVTVYTEVGDVNCDGFVNMDDLTTLINYLLTDDESLIKAENADVNLSGAVSMDDLTTLINYLLIGKWPWEHEWVDLGLPSGTLWATCNVGANTPEEYGDYFAWGETESKETYNWSTYKWWGGYNTFTKYCIDSSYGTVDNKTELDPEDDAACVNWGPAWRMPSIEQISELCNSCTWKKETRNGVNGSLVIGPNGNTIFLPAAGYRLDGTFDETGSVCRYWSSTLASGFPESDTACLLYAYFMSDYAIDYYGDYRYSGNTVRAVRLLQD